MSTKSGLQTVKVLAPAFLMLFASSAVVLPLGARPLDPSTAAGVFPPWWSRSQAIDAAGKAGSILGTGVAPFIVAVRAPGRDVQARLGRAGALFSIDPHGSWLCSGRKVSHDVQDDL